MKSIYFGGGSWCSAFYIGIVKALEKQYGPELHQKFTFAGDSVGSFVALLCSLGYSSDEGAKIYIDLAKKARENGVWNGKMSIYHNDLLDLVINDKNIYKTLEDRKFEVGVSTYWDKHKVYTKWRDNDHLRETIHASFHVPFYCSYQGPLDGNISYDGGFSIDKDLLGKYDIVIGRGSCYDIHIDIAMMDVIYPPSYENIKKQIGYGYLKGTEFDFEDVDKTKRAVVKKDFKGYLMLKMLVLLELFLNKYLNVYWLLNSFTEHRLS